VNRRSDSRLRKLLLLEARDLSPKIAGGLLYSVLESCPELIAQVLPETSAAVAAAPWQIQTTFNISEREVRMAFTRLIKYRSLDKSHCFCFFIDGLDEFEETTQYDHRAIAELLCSWTKGAPGNVKLCVSSREYNVFMNMFSPDNRLRLHELTQGDMETFIQDRLNHIPNPENRHELVKAITDKAQGVFLWVTLVTKSIRDQLENGATISDMKRELDTLPDELDGLYEYILQSLSQSSRRGAYHILKMLDEANISDEMKISISSFAYSFLEEYEQDPEFAIKNGFFELGIDDMTRQQNVKLARRRLNGYCRGLVEANSSDVLDYTHRSVAEFLRNPRIRDAMVSFTSEFNAPDAISQLLLAELRLRKQPSVVSRTECPPLLLMRSKNKLDQPPYSFLLCFEAALDPTPWEYFKYGEPSCEFMVDYPSKAILVCVNDASRAKKRRVGLHAPLYVLTLLNYHEYPVWKILHDPTATDTVTKATVLMYCSVNANSSPSSKHSSGAYVFDVLLEHNLLAANTKTNLWPVWYEEPGGGTELTIWQHCLISIFLQYQGNKDEDTVYGRIVEAFLRQKPDLNFALTCKPTSRSSGTTGFDKFTVIKRGPGLSESIEVNLYTWTHLDLFDFPCLRAWIDHTGLENKNHLLQMYDSQMEMARASPSQNDTASHVDLNDRDATIQQVDQRLGLAPLEQSILEDLGDLEQAKLQTAEQQNSPPTGFSIHKKSNMGTISFDSSSQSLMPEITHVQISRYLLVITLGT
jgi:hypothetical protein